MYQFYYYAQILNKVDLVLQYLSCRFLRSQKSITMKGTTIRPQSHYLDISEYLLKEHSPCFRPKVPEIHQVNIFDPYLEIFHLFYQIYMKISPDMAISPRCMTPELSPVIDGLNVYMMKTPLIRLGKQIGASLFEVSDMEEFSDFSLEGGNLSKNQSKSKKIKKTFTRPRLQSTWHFVDCELEQILEEKDKNDEAIQDNSDSQNYSEEEEIESQMDDESSKNNEQQKELELEKQSTTNFDLLLSQQPLYLQWHQANPKKQLLNKIKSISLNEQLKNDEEKIESLKSIIGNYIFEHERYYFEESMGQLTGSIANIITILTKGIDQTFRRTIGGLSFEKRRLKLVKYMEKKKRRVWRKKVNYDCRKKVADGRLRIKGKFVTYEQARQQLGMSSLEGYNADEIKNMIEKKSVLDC